MQTELRGCLQAEGTGSKDPEPKLEPEPQPEELSEDTTSPSKEEASAEAEVDKQPPEADHFTGGSRFAALESLHADSAPAASSREAASGSSSSGSPQPSPQLQNGTQNGDLPRSAARAAQAAQAPAPAAQKEGPWQEVRASRRKATSPQAASKSSMRRAPKQGSGTHGQTRCAQQADQPPDGQPAREAAEHLPQWLPGLADYKPQELSQHKVPDTTKHPRPQAHPPSMQHKPMQATSVNFLLDKSEIQHTGPGSRTFPAKVGLMP